MLLAWLDDGERNSEKSYHFSINQSALQKRIMFMEWKAEGGAKKIFSAETTQKNKRRNWNEEKRISTEIIDVLIFLYKTFS